MSPDRRKRKAERAVIDRVEGNTAVLLVGDDEDEFNVDTSKLPEGAEANSTLMVGRVDGSSGSRGGLVIIGFHGDDRRRSETEGSLRDRLAALKQRGRG